MAALRMPHIQGAFRQEIVIERHQAFVIVQT